MATLISRFFCLLTLLCFSWMVFFVSWGHFSQRSKKNIRWTVVSNRHRLEGQLAERRFVKQQRENPLSLLDVLLAAFGESLDFKERNPLTPRADETPMPVLSQRAFKTLPRWDFEEVYNQDSSPRPTKCANSVRNSKDENFQKAFLPSIRLFLHKDNINMSEWNRLSHFNNPFGFMDLKYEEVMTAVKLIPKPPEPLLLPKPGGDGCVRCAVVGNAGILNGSKKGAEIDAHDYVFRMNGAIIRGYEEDVGNRTSVYVHSAHSIIKSLYVLKKYGYISAPHDEGIKYVMMPERLKDFQWLEGLLKGERVAAGPFLKRTPRLYYSGQYNESRFYVLHQDFLRYIRNRFLKSPKLNSKEWSGIRPTNGAFTLFLALHTCDTVSAYGFITADFRKYSNYYAQRDTKTEFFFHPNHDFFLEMDTWINFHNSKIIRLYQRKESERGTEKPERL